jgi:eukaryotic-like serine/threonine-protein kinase
MRIQIPGRPTVTAGMLLLLSCTTVLAQDASMYRGGPTRAGVFAGPSVRSYGGLQWRVMTGGPVRATPAIAEGRVIVGSGDGKVHALDLRTGDRVWRHDAGNPVTSSAVVANGVVYFTTNDNVVHAIAAGTGEPLWSTATGPDVPWDWGHENADLWTSSPLIVDGRVIVGSGDAHIYALDAATGSIAWRFRTGGRVRSSPAAYEGKVVAGSMDGSVYVLAVETGALLARADTEGRSLFSGDFGFDRKSIHDSPAADELGFYVGGKDGFLYGFDWDGVRRWRANHDISWALRAPAVDGERVFATSSDARFIHAVDRRTGREIWRASSVAPVWTAPAVVGDVVHAADGAGVLYTLDRESGRELWRFHAGGQIRSSPVAADGLVVFGSDDGAIYALRAGDALRRAVFWDSVEASLGYYRGHAELRDYLAARGYTVVGQRELSDWIRPSAEASHTIVVFAASRLPDDVLGDAGADSPLRQFLAAHGTVVWLGVPPLIRRTDTATGAAPPLGDTRWDEAGRYLGVNMTEAIFDTYGATPTVEGRRRGLSGWWLTAWSAVDGTEGLTALALDENGRAPLWERNFGGPPGTGFVRTRAHVLAKPDLVAIHGAAEYRPLR